MYENFKINYACWYKSHDKTYYFCLYAPVEHFKRITFVEFFFSFCSNPNPTSDTIHYNKNNSISNNDKKKSCGRCEYKKPPIFPFCNVYKPLSSRNHVYIAQCLKNRKNNVMTKLHE